MSLHPNSICSQLSILSAALISISTLVLSEAVVCVEGYTGNQFLEAILKLRKFIAGSCNPSILIPISIKELLLMRSCWHAGNLLISVAKLSVFHCPTPS
jgi:hypothetical protein